MELLNYDDLTQINFLLMFSLSYQIFQKLNTNQGPISANNRQRYQIFYCGPYEIILNVFLFWRQKKSTLSYYTLITNKCGEQ